ncbi:MAG TPA: hypothetical protein EYG89_00750 [Bacteroidia bacterium]|nr:hypothetical protein [Bacteroidia bacterium]
MNRELYQEYLSETSKLVSDRLETISNTYKDIDKELHQSFNIVFSGRVGKKLLKPTLFRLVYEMYGGKNFIDIIDIAVIFELINISSYQSNASFDHKMGAYTKAEKDSQFIASFLTRELANSLVYNLDICDDLKFKILQEISKINKNIYLAQHYDLNMMTIDNYETYSNDIEKYYIDYNERCRLGSGYFSGATAKVAALLAGANEKDAKYIFKITEKYGTLLHMINDIGDYVPKEKYPNRIYQDDLSDFKNGRLTLPLFLLLTETNTKISNYKEEEIISEIQIFLSDSKNYITSQYSSLKKELNGISSTDAGNMYKLLLTTLKSNKYFYRISNGK